MDRRTLLAIILCCLIYYTWQRYLVDPHWVPLSQETQMAQKNAITPLSSMKGAVKDSVSQGSRLIKQPQQSMPVRTSISDLVIGDGQSFFIDWKLNQYKLGMAEDASAVDLSAVIHQKESLILTFSDPEYLYLDDIQGDFKKNSDGVLWTFEDERVKLTRQFKMVSQNPFVDVMATVEFKKQHPELAFLSLTARAELQDGDLQDRFIAYWIPRSLEMFLLKDKISYKEIQTPIHYMAAMNRYFVLSVVAQGEVQPTGLIQPMENQTARMSFVYPIKTASLQIPFRVYFGSKELSLLRSTDPALDHTIDFGWCAVLAYPLLKILKWFHQFSHNYGICIILLTLLLKLILYPLTYKSMKMAKKMTVLNPQIQAIRECYKDKKDPQAMNQEVRSLMKANGYNPMSGCLPMLIQMPIFYALYRVLYTSIELYHAPFLFWIHDLSSRDPYYITPILLTFTLFLQQKMTPQTATDPAQARMLQLMPLLFGVFMLALPAGLTLYMLVNALASIAQQMLLNRQFQGDGKPLVIQKA